MANYLNLNMRVRMNNANPNEVADCQRQLNFGDVIGWLIQKQAYDETGVTPSSNVAQLANVPSVVLDVVSTAGTFTGRLTLKVGGGAPTSGQVVWGGLGSKALTFAGADAVTAVSVKYCRADLVNCKVGALERELGQRDAG